MENRCTQAIELKTSNSILNKVVVHILCNIAEEITLADLESASGASKFAVIRLFKKEYGTTPLKWIWDLRIQYAYELLTTLNDCRIIDVACFCGFTSQAHLSRKLKLRYNQTASQLKNTSQFVGCPVTSLEKAYASIA